MDSIRTARMVVTEVAGGDICARTWGDSGPPIVLLHHSFGWPDEVALGVDLGRDHVVWAPDIPGFGSSAQPAWARHPRDLAIVMGQWMREVFDGPVTLVGLGLGGWVAAELATMAPTLLSNLVLVGSAGLRPVDGQIFDQIMVNHSTYVRTAFGSSGAYERSFGVELDDDLLLRWDVCREMVTRITWKPYMHSHQLAPLLSGIETSTVVVWGEDDEVVPRSCGVQFAELIDGAQLVVVPGCGHAVGLEQPGVLAELVRSRTGDLQTIEGERVLATEG